MEALIELIGQIHKCPHLINNGLQVGACLGPIVNQETDEDIVFYKVECVSEDKGCWCRMQPLQHRERHSL
mgnify:CR=1 FL=1